MSNVQNLAQGVETVLLHFGSYQYCTSRCCHPVKFQPVSYHRDTDAVGLCLVWPNLYNNAAICYCFAFWYFASGDKENFVVPFWHERYYALG